MSRTVFTSVLGMLLAGLFSGCAERQQRLLDPWSVPTAHWSNADLLELPVRIRVPSKGHGTFTDARAIAIDARGRIYVSDGGMNVIWYADPLVGDALTWHTLGGPGRGNGQFLAPDGMDVDAGSILSVADAGNERVQRFTRNGALMELIPIRSQATSDVLGVQSLSDGTLFVLTESAPYLFRMDRERERMEPVYLDAAFADAKLVDLSRVGRGVAVLDATGLLHVLNNAGTTIRRVEGLNLTGIDPIAGGMLGLSDQGIIVFDEWPEPLERWAIQPLLSVRGAALLDHTLHVITGTHLHRVP